MSIDSRINVLRLKRECYSLAYFDLSSLKHQFGDINPCYCQGFQSQEKILPNPISCPLVSANIK